LSQWIIQIPLAYFLSKGMNLGVRGIWLAFPVTYVLTTIVAYLVFAKGNWKKTKIIKKENQRKVTSFVKSEEVIPFD
jgi:Na+-driven multidrug efflux pump